MKRSLKWGLGALVLVLLAAGIGRAVIGKRGAESAATASATAAKAPSVLDLAAADIVTAAPRELSRMLDISGSVRAVNTAFVKARVAGEIRHIAVREGDPVKAGQVLVQQDSTEFDWRVRQADQQAQSARAQLEIAQRTLVNNKALVAQGFISPTALDTSVSNEAAAQANLQAALAAVELAKKARADATLTAPISGLVSQRLAQPGERAAVEARLLEIVDLSKLEIEAALTPEDVAAVRPGSTARLQVDGITGEVTARVARINPSAQAGSRAVPVYLAIDPHPALRHGLFARGRIELERKRVLAVPASSVRLEQAQPYVLVVEGGSARQRSVKTGVRGVADGVEVVEILSGVNDGAQVLAGTAGAVRDGTAVRVAAAPAAPVVRGAAAPASAASAASSR